MKKLRIGIIGCGNIFTMHATSANLLETANLVAVCDIKENRAAIAGGKYGANVYTDYKLMIERERLDVVHICTPHYLHPIISKYAIMHGINTLCEKPMAIKLEDALENIKLAKEYNVKYGIIFQCRYNDASKLVKEYLDNGLLGKVISARVVLTWDKPDSYYALSDWKGTWEKEGGGVVIDQAIHSLDLANWFINDSVKEVQAHLTNRSHDIMEVDDTAEGLIKYCNGATLSFYAMNNYGCDEPIEIRLLCENGNAKLNYDEAHIALNNGKNISIKQGNDKVSYENGKDYWGFQHIKQIANFYDSVLNNTDPDITATEALKIQKIICEIYKNGNFVARQKQFVTF